MKPTKLFLEKLKGDEIKVFFQAYDINTEEDLSVFFQGKLVDFDDKELSIESETDYKVVDLDNITTLFSLTKTRKGPELESP